MFGLLGILQDLLSSSLTTPGTRRIRSVALTGARFAVVASGLNYRPEKVDVVSVVVAAEEVVLPVERVAAEDLIRTIAATSAEGEATMLGIVPSRAEAKDAGDPAAAVLGLVRAICARARRATAVAAAVTEGEIAIATVIVTAPAVPGPRLRRSHPEWSVR